MSVMRRIVKDIDTVQWLQADEKEQLSNTFISDLACRYNYLENLSVPGFGPTRHKLLLIKVLERIGAIKTSILDKCKKRKTKMMQRGIFGKETNSSRMCAFFRIELCRRINVDEIIKSVAFEFEGEGRKQMRVLPGSRQERLKTELEQFKEALEEAVHPIPHLVAPQLKSRPQDQDKAQKALAQQQSDCDLMPDSQFQTSEQLRKSRLSRNSISLSSVKARKLSKRVSSVGPLEGIESQALALVSGRTSQACKLDVVDDESDPDSEDDDEDSDADTYTESDFEFDIDPTMSSQFSAWVKDDPLLRAHTETSFYQRRMIERQQVPKKRTRYLVPTKMREKYLTDFDYDSIDKSVDRINDDIAQNPVRVSDSRKPDSGMASKQILRSVQSQISSRVPKGFITLSADPAAGVTEFGNVFDLDLLENLDEKLNRFKEVEELYNEIMKTIVGSHFDIFDDYLDEDTSGCPAAPLDSSIPLSPMFEGFMVEQQPNSPNSYQAMSRWDEIGAALRPNAQQQGESTRPSSPEIRLLTRENKVTVTPDDYIRNRAEAMRKTPSSRYGGEFRYNFGGYLPHSDSNAINKRFRKGAKSDSFGVQDYVDFLRPRTCDFVLDLLVDHEADAEALRKANEERIRLQTAEEQKKRYEKEREEKTRRRDAYMRFERGQWNPGVLEFIEEMHDRDIVRFLSENALGEWEVTQGKLKDKSGLDEKGSETAQDLGLSPSEDPDGPGGKSAKKQVLQHRDSELLDTPTSTRPSSSGVHDPRVGRTSSTTDTVGAEGGHKRFALQPTDSMVNIPGAQQDLEAVWVTLKMPLDQKLDMAIKYGSHRFAPKLEKAIQLWKVVAEHIIDREELLKEIESFERDASDPERFFKKGFEGSSEARLKEAKIRENLMGRLHYIEARLREFTSTIKVELGETVTYEGGWNTPFIDLTSYVLF
ncbi:Coiled-coil domain-containing protein 87 [Quaeritorhiza haematococci]|nr:Coiled-coil domain-containing protein 87 [Quaeritorhiza haematococci]